MLLASFRFNKIQSIQIEQIKVIEHMFAAAQMRFAKEALQAF